jgi:hypothetical protein
MTPGYGRNTRRGGTGADQDGHMPDLLLMPGLHSVGLFSRDVVADYGAIYIVELQRHRSGSLGPDCAPT